MSRWTSAYLAQRFALVIAVGTLPLAQYGLAGEACVFLSDDAAVIGETTPFRLAQQPVDMPGAEAELEPPPDVDPFAELEQLLESPLLVPALEQEVTTVSRQESTVGKSAAAVHVITAEDIRRSGFRSIPEILRMAPGVNVARLEGNVWGVSVRGFNDEFANKLLVLVDGREVYTPAFGGVHWDVVDTMIEDIERIEVIRGPGGTIWGNNAVNGVINIITKKAEDTQGVLANGGAGTEQRAFGGVRVGGRIDENTHYRIYTKGFNRDRSTAAGIPDTNDDWRQGRLGFRIDRQLDRNGFTLQGDVYSGNHGHLESANLTIPPDREHVYGGDMLARFTHVISDDSDWSLQVYYDYQDRNLDNVATPFERRQGLFDIDFQHRFPLGEFHKIIWGASYRFSHDKFVSGPDLFPPSLALDPASLIYHTYSIFVQDEIELLEDRLYFTAGSKFSWNHFSNFEAQPSGRLSWIPANRFMTWGSVSRAVRIPTRADDALTASFGAIPISLPNRGLLSEEVVAYELGWRYAPTDCLFLDMAVFYNDYDELRTRETTAGPTVRGSMMFGETYGFEVASTAQMTDSWSIKLAYSYLQSQLHLDPGSTDLGSAISIPSELAGEGGSPHNQVYARSSWDLGRNWQFDLGLRYVDNLPVVVIPAYLEADARLAWRPRGNLELSVVGHNLFDGSHREFSGQILRFATGTEVERSVYGMVQYEF